jgi:transcriptional regulator with AAA-type ATPase domain
MPTSVDTTHRLRDSVAEVARTTRLVLRWVAPVPLGVTRLGPSVVVGRGEDCDFPLLVEGVSRKHVEIYRRGPVLGLRDLASTNGVFLNGQRVQHSSFVSGDVLRIGNAVGVFSTVAEGLEEQAFGELGPGLFGGPELELAVAEARRAASGDLPIALIGATGTGKERVARAIHAWSARRGPFHPVNCAALAPNLAEAELFGHQRGAFTGADRDGLGHFRAAHGGTLFLDEAAELAAPLQAKLLRVLEDGQVTPVGGTRAVAADVRLVLAFQESPAALVAAGRLRDDLCARILGVPVTLPKLVERKADVPYLFREFLRMHSGGRQPDVEAKVFEMLCLYGWPHNVRELELVTRRLLVLRGLEPVLRTSHLPASFAHLVESERASSTPPPEGSLSRDAGDLRRLTAALQKSDGNVKLAAKLAGFSRQRAYRLMNGRTPEELSLPLDPSREIDADGRG